MAAESSSFRSWRCCCGCCGRSGCKNKISTWLTCAAGEAEGCAEGASVRCPAETIAACRWDSVQGDALRRECSNIGAPEVAPLLALAAAGCCCWELYGRTLLLAPTVRNIRLDPIHIICDSRVDACKTIGSTAKPIRDNANHSPSSIFHHHQRSPTVSLAAVRSLLVCAKFCLRYCSSIGENSLTSIFEDVTGSPS